MTMARAYGLTIDSAIPLPGLPQAAAGSVADIAIRLGAPDTEEAHSALTLDVTGVARFVIADGREIRVSPDPGAAPETVRLFLMGSAMGALLQQRGLLVLHGNAIRIGDSCMVCIGASGAGKSTLAAGFAQRGHAPLADDVVAVTPDGLALPGLPRIRLWRDAAVRLGHDIATLARVRPEFDKFELAAATDPHPLPIRWIHAIEVTPGAALSTRRIDGATRIQLLRNHSYRPQFIARTMGEAAHFARTAALAAQVAMYRTVRPDAGDTLTAMIETLLSTADQGTGSRCA